MNLKKGNILISDPSLTEQTFFKSVILITYHSTDESIGLILNQPTKIFLHEILNNVPSNHFPIYIGGPVAKNSIHFIHTLGNIITDTQEISKGLFWGGDFNIVLKLMSENKISRNNIRFFAGYSGWMKNQLINEIRENSWIIHQSNTNLSMEYSDQDLWSKLINTKKSKYAIWANMPKNPSLN